MFIFTELKINTNQAQITKKTENLSKNHTLKKTLKPNQ